MIRAGFWKGFEVVVFNGRRVLGFFFILWDFFKMRKSFKDSLKALEADIQLANTL